MKQRIEDKLKNSFNSKFLEVKNNSHLHLGHLGDDGSGETHFQITIESDDLKGLNQVSAHRKINAVLKDEFAGGMHALEIKVVK